MNSIIRFIRYNNAVPIAFSLAVFLAAGTFAASPEARESMRRSLVSSQSVVRSVDNTKLLAADIANLEFKPQIIAVTEDSENYYIEYSYRTFILEDYIWQVREKRSKLAVAKDALGVRDLGDYAAEELKEVISYERSYLAETKNIEKITGATQKVVTTTYLGLIGRFFDEKQEIFPGYVKVVKAPEPVIAPISNSIEANNSAPTVFAQAQIPEQVTAEYIRSIVKELLARTKEGNNYDNNRNAIINDGGQQDFAGVAIAPNDSVLTNQSATTTAYQDATAFSGGDSSTPEDSASESQDQAGAEPVLMPVAEPPVESLPETENQLPADENQPASVAKDVPLSAPAPSI